MKQIKRRRSKKTIITDTDMLVIKAAMNKAESVFQDSRFESVTLRVRGFKDILVITFGQDEHKKARILEFTREPIKVEIS